MKKLISILLVVALLAICLCSCEVIRYDSLHGEDTTTTTAPEETTTKGPWSPNVGGEAGPIELPGIGIKPTVGA